MYKIITIALTTSFALFFSPLAEANDERTLLIDSCMSKANRMWKSEKSKPERNVCECLVDQIYSKPIKKMFTQAPQGTRQEVIISLQNDWNSLNDGNPMNMKGDIKNMQFAMFGLAMTMINACESLTADYK